MNHPSGREGGEKVRAYDSTNEVAAFVRRSCERLSYVLLHCVSSLCRIDLAAAFNTAGAPV